MDSELLAAFPPLKHYLAMECWRQIPDDPLYEVSNLGRVRSWKPVSNSSLSKALEPKLLKPIKQKTGYFNVALSGHRKASIHRLMLLAFSDLIGEKPAAKNHAAHLDGNKTKNLLENLIWASSKENAAHMKIHGSFGSAKLRPKTAEIIRRLLKSGVKGSVIAAAFDVGNSTVSRIKKSQSWKP